VPKQPVLLVAGETHQWLPLCDRLHNLGYSVQVVTDGRSGYEAARREHFDLILLDLTLPDMDGLDLCRDLLREGIRVPILMLSADQYLKQPFEQFGLLVSMEAVLQRSSAERQHEEPCPYSFGPIRVDFTRKQVLREDNPVVLLPREYRLLCYFIEHRGIVLSRRMLLDDVWGHDGIPTSRTVDVHVSGLRRKLELYPRHPRYLLTVHHRGYKFIG
jgi:two-component system alkaline phosphatase synthesis response regulator PhoP